MSQFSLITAVPAGAVVANAFAGSAFEFLRSNSRVTIASVVEVGGVGVVTGTIQFGPEVQLEEGAIHVEALAGRGPIMPDDIIVDDVAAGGDRLVERLTNTGGAPFNVMTKVKITPLG